MTASGFGPKLHDLRHGTNHHAVFDEWWQFARREYLGLDLDTPLKKVTWFYDPLLDVHHRMPVKVALICAFWLTNQVPEDALRLYEASSADAGLRELEPALVHPQPVAQGLFLAREWGDHDVAARLAEAAEARYEPTWDRRTGEFTWGFGLNEQYPRGQYNAAFAAAEAVSEGAWRRVGRGRVPDGPAVVEGVDFPTVGLSEARWKDGALHLRLSAQNSDVLGSRTSFDVVGLAQPHIWRVEGRADTTAEVTPDGALRIATIVDTTPLRVLPF